MASVKSAIPLDQLIRSGDRKMFTTTDDNALMKQVLATHAPDGRELVAKPLLQIVEDILLFAAADDGANTSATEAAMEDKSQLAGGIEDMLEALSYTINRLSTEIAYRCLESSDAHATTLSILNMLSSYQWDAKLVLTLAAFSLHYGDFWLLAQIHYTNRLAKNMAVLRQIPSTLEYANQLKPRIDALKHLTKSMLDLTKSIITFRELPSSYISSDAPAFQGITAAIPTVAYWTIRGVVAAATHIANLNIGLGNAYTASTTEAWELSSLAHKIMTISDYIQKQLDTCLQLVEEKKYSEAYEMLVQIFEAVHIDNMKILKSLISAKDDRPPLFHGASQRRVPLDDLRKKWVLLLISGLNISSDELAILEQIYHESQAQKAVQYFEIVWMPIIDRSVELNESMLYQLEQLRSMMPWYSIIDLRCMEPPVIRLIKEKFHFKNNSILVVLDPQGKMVNPNAIHMMWIWGTIAFPFTSYKEEVLWKEEKWRTELPVDGIDPNILNWIREERYIFLYGGDDIEWIRKFTTGARAVAQRAHIPLEMSYTGKINSKADQARMIIQIITMEKLSDCWPDLTMAWFFWTRLESMLFSKIQLGSTIDDAIMKEIKKLLSYGKSDGGWAMLCRGSHIAVTGHGPTVLATLEQFDAWTENAEVIGFEEAFKQHYNKLDTHPCCRLDFPTTGPIIPERMTCPDCNRGMEKFITFSCCHE